MIEKQIVVNNLLINYYFSEAKTKTPSTDALGVVFLHGWRADGKIWFPVINQLEHYHVYALDLPGFGKSQKPKQGFTLQDYADVVKGFIEKFNLESLILVGHSFGGRIAIKLAAANIVSIRKLVLVDSAGFRNDSIKRKAITATAKIFKPLVPQAIKNKLYRIAGAEDYIARPDLRETFVNIINEDLSADMQEIQTPTLIIWGKNDKETPIEFGEKMHSLIPNSQFLILENAGHFSFLDKSEEFVKALGEFINERV